MADEETVYVEITATAKVDYSKYVRMPKEAYDIYLKACEMGAKDKWFSDFAEEWGLADSDICGIDTFEDVEVIIKKEE